MAACPLLVARLSQGPSLHLLVDSKLLLLVDSKLLLSVVARLPHSVTKLHLLAGSLCLVFQKQKKKRRERLKRKD